MMEDIAELRQWLTNLTGNMWKTIFLFIVSAMTLVLPILSQDAGVTEDERLHCEHGQRMLHYYMGTDSTAGISPILSDGQWQYSSDSVQATKSINVYGGAFDLLGAVVYGCVTHHFIGEYESRHILSALCGVLLIVCTGLIAWTLTDSWAAAVIALVLMFSSPRIIGHSLSNPKDIPFAAACAFSLFQILRALRDNLQWRWTRIIMLILSFALAIDCRAGGMLMILFFLIGVGSQAVVIVWQSGLSLGTIARPMVIAAAIAIGGYLASSILWPIAHHNPITVPVSSILILSKFSVFNSLSLFEGHRVSNLQVPWYFIPKWFYISMPICFIIGLCFFGLLAYYALQHSHSRWIPYGIVLLAAVLPIVVVIVQQSNLYDDGRHLYFTLAPLYALAAVGWYWFSQHITDRAIAVPVAISTGLLVAEPIWFIAASHPYESMYFTPLIGGVDGAFKQYEMDYWGVSVRAATEWIDHTDSLLAHDRKTNVRLWYGEQHKLSYYTAKSKHLQYVLTNESSNHWDYGITLPLESKHNPNLLDHWPPPNTIHQIMVGNTPLCAIVKNPSNHSTPLQTTQSASSATMINLGMVKYNAKDYNGAAVIFKKVLVNDPSNQLAINNLVSTYNFLGLYDATVKIGKPIALLHPTNNLLVNNVKCAEKALAVTVPSESYYLNMSYNYFQQQDYQNCIAAAEKAIHINPKCSRAYNNICSSHNALGEYTKAKAACSQSLLLEPHNDYALNNLKIAEQHLHQ
jgi:Tfp pilus assembly protein PilF